MFFTGEFIQYRIESNTKIGRILAFVTDENNNTKIKVQQFLYNYELPRNFHSAARDSTKLWMTDRVIMISESRIITRISVWLKDNQEPSSYDYKVDEILYKFNNRYMMRPIKFRHHHPSEYIKLHPSPPGIQTLKIFIDLYFDDFGTFRTSYHSLGGLYVQFGNFPLKLRQQLKNHFLIGFVPFGGNFEDVIRPFINDLLILQKGLFMKIGNEEYWVSGGLGVVTADLPQGNDLAGVLRHNANLGCRSCKSTKEELTLLDYDIQLHSRYHHITNDEFLEIQQCGNRSTKITNARSFGLCLKPNILDELFRDRHIQTPQDPFHMMAGLGGRLLDSTFEIFTKEGLENFIITWKNFEMPTTWSRQQNPVTHRHSYFMSDVLRLTMIFPFLLRRFLDSTMVKSEVIQEIKSQNSLQRASQAVLLIKQCWINFALLAKLVFTSTLKSTDYIRIDQLTKTFSDVVLKVRILMIS
jgi:hypothetical protein